MFRLIMLSSILIISNSCGSSKKITGTEIIHEYNNVSFVPEQLKKNISGKTEITITPIDAKNLNQETFEAAKRDGNYEKELTSLIEQKRSELSGMTKQEKEYYESRISAINKISDLVKKSEITAEAGYLMQLRAWQGKENGKDGTEVSTLSKTDNYPDNFNPFKINEKFLSIFKITFENKGDDIEKFNPKYFQVISGEEQLYPLGIEYFEKKYLQTESEKVKNVYRMNMPDELIITPNQRITKYLAVPAINSTNNVLQLQFIKDNNVSTFDFEVTEKKVKKSYKVDKYEIFYESARELTGYDFFYVVTYSDGISFPTITNSFYVSEERKNLPVSVYCISVNRKSARSFFGKIENMNLSDLKKNKIVIDLKEVK